MKEKSLKKDLKVNIIIPTYRRFELLNVTVDSFCRELVGLDWIIYVVNNYPVEKIIFQDDRIVVLDNFKNGPCQARNLALEKMRKDADVIWYADDDLFISNLDPLISFMNQNLFDCISFSTLGMRSHRANRVLKSIFWYLIGEEPLRFSGGNSICVPSVANTKWDESYFGYSFGEDVEYGYRLVQSGFRLGNMISPKVVHFGDYRKSHNKSLHQKIVSGIYCTKLYRINKRRWYVYYLILVVLGGFRDASIIRLLPLFFVQASSVMKHYKGN